MYGQHVLLPHHRLLYRGMVKMMNVNDAMVRYVRAKRTARQMARIIKQAMGDDDTMYCCAGMVKRSPTGKLSVYLHKDAGKGRKKYA